MHNKFFNYSIVILLSIFFAYILYTFGMPEWLIIIIIILFIIALMIGYPFYVIYKSKNMKLIGRYLTTHKKKPIFQYAYALSHENNEEVIDSLKRVLAAYPQAEVQEVYKANLAIFQKDWQKLITFSDQMTNPLYKDYYRGIGYAMKNDREAAAATLSKVPVPWMKHSLSAIIALKNKDRGRFRIERDQSVANAVGMQRYVLFYTLKRMEESILPVNSAK
ncbi:MULTISPECIES: hypothetical protein [Sporosarcina]|uniref:Uncharacterized protein n=1 Tax=Sporosarcina contaminans TaxID=633403 RepID=A0ABW3U1Z1_9BACL